MLSPSIIRSTELVITSATATTTLSSRRYIIAKQIGFGELINIATTDFQNKGSSLNYLDNYILKIKTCMNWNILCMYISRQMFRGRLTFLSNNFIFFWSGS